MLHKRNFTRTET